MNKPLSGQFKMRVKPQSVRNEKAFLTVSRFSKVIYGEEKLDRAGVTSACSFCRGPELGSQNPLGGSQPFVTSH